MIFHMLLHGLIKCLKFAVVLHVLVSAVIKVDFHICLEIDFASMTFLKIKMNKIKGKRHSCVRD